MQEDEKIHGSFAAAVGAVVAASMALAVGGCGPGSEEREAALGAAEREAMVAVQSAIDSADAILAAQIGLTAATRRELRRFLNTRQVATARDLGVEPVGDSAAAIRLVGDGRLVPLEDTRHWVLRDLTHSVPYVTPDTRAMLVDLGERFHHRLDSLGLPRFRFEITSVLRTTAMQEELRRGNPNASRTTSSHEFGTTLDVTYHTFAPPADFVLPRGASIPDTLGVSIGERQRLQRRIESRTRAALAELAEERAAALKGILGQVLQEMQQEGRVQALIERAQPVYHMTVAARYPPEGGEPEVAR